MDKICKNCACMDVCIHYNPNRTQECKLWQARVPSKWISVKDRLPAPGQMVLAVLNEPIQRLNYPYKERILILLRKGCNYITGYKEKWQRAFGAETISYEEIVTHWMPLPELPEEDKQ